MSGLPKTRRSASAGHDGECRNDSTHPDRRPVGWALATATIILGLLSPSPATGAGKPVKGIPAFVNASFESASLADWTDILRRPIPARFRRCDLRVGGEGTTNASQVRFPGRPSLGGDYWHVPIRMVGGAAADGRCVLSATGTVVSPAFRPRSGQTYLTFLAQGARASVMIQTADRRRTLQRMRRLSLTAGVLQRVGVRLPNGTSAIRVLVINQTREPLLLDDFRLSRVAPRAVGGRAGLKQLFGFADLHTHPAAHLGYGGLLVAGTPAGVVPGAWPRNDTDFWSDLDLGCRAYEQGNTGGHNCHNTGRYGLQCNTAAAPVAIKLFTVAGRAKHPAQEQGSSQLYFGPRRPYGTFARPYLSAPSWYDASHQMMHINWIRRAYEGGLRLLVADAVNNRALEWLLQSNPGRPPMTDSEAIISQFKYIRDLARANSSWMEIVLSPVHARRVISQGKLAIVLGTEVDTFGECNTVTSFIRESGANVKVADRCDMNRVRRQLDLFFGMGQRKITPIHLADNGFGGMALYGEIFNAASNWYNRGDQGDPCADPRLPARFCPGARVPRDRDSQYPASAIQAVMAHRGDVYKRTIGWAQLRDGRRNLDAAGFHFPASIPYLTISHNPVPGLNVKGCVGAGFCADQASFQVALPGYGDNVPDLNAVGLTDKGRNLLRELMRRGMLIDLQHMSDKAVNEVLGLVDPGLGRIPGSGVGIASRGNRRCGRLSVSQMDTNRACADAFYPVMSSHGGLRYLRSDRPSGCRTGTGSSGARGVTAGGAVECSGGTERDWLSLGGTALPSGQNENARTREQLRRIYQTGGMVGLGVSGGSLAFAQAYRVARKVVGTFGIALGSDLNGGEGGAPPRLMEWDCYLKFPTSRGRTVRYAHTRQRYSAKICSTTPRSQTLRFEPDNAPGLKQMSLPPNRRLPANLQRTNPLDINTDGLANIGMYPDYLQDVRTAGIRKTEMSSLFQSAERFVQMWEKSCRIAQRISREASAGSCLCDPGVASQRRFCPPSSPGLVAAVVVSPTASPGRRAGSGTRPRINPLQGVPTNVVALHRDVGRYFSFAVGFDHTGGDYRMLRVGRGSFVPCARACQREARCKAFTWLASDGRCYLKSRANRRVRRVGYVTGSKRRSLPAARMPTRPATRTVAPRRRIYRRRIYRR